MDKTPEQIAAEREAALRALKGSTPPPAGTPPVPGSGGRERFGSVDFKKTAQDAKSLDRQEPLKLAELNAKAQGQTSPWETRDRTLISTDEEGVPVDKVSRHIDMNIAKEYGHLSKNAIGVINKYFAQTQCSELHFNAPDKIFAKVNGERVQVKAEFSSEEEYNRFIEDLIKQADTHKTLEEIKVQARDVIRMAGGDRMAILMPPLTETIQAAIHKVIARTWDIKDLVEKGTMTPNMAEFLRAAVKAKTNILVCGEMGAGKSVMLSLLANEIGANERVALIEEVPEIFFDKPDVSRITYYPNSTSSTPMGLPEVIDTVLYMRMDRVIVGEIHDQGMYRMLRTMAAGSDGALSTFHAGSVEQALEQVRNHILLEHGSIPSSVAAHFIRQAINLVVVVERVDDQHRVVEVAEVEWRNLSNATDTIGRNQLYSFDRQTKEFKVEGRLDEKGKILEKAKKHRIVMRPEWFAGDAFGYRQR